MSGPLVGWMPLGKTVPFMEGVLTIDANAVDEWAHAVDLTPVLMGHDRDRPVGWVTRAILKTDCLYLLGEFDDLFDPTSRAAGHVIRHKIISGLSPAVDIRQGYRMYGTGQWGQGTVISFPEVSIVGTPRIPRAHWEAPGR